jgi:erythritol transport system ATP-binding protein
MAEVQKPEPVLRAEQVTRRYPGTVALKGVDLNVYPGAVNVLIGENGAGKSTLMKILAGVERPTSGRLVLRGAPIALGSPREALRHGIAIIYQELNLFPNLSVSENIFMARERTSRLGTVRHGDQAAAARALMDRLEQDIDPGILVEDLRIGQQQLVEIARALAQEVSILIMDEPTSALSTAEAEVLLRLVEDLTAHGVAVIYVSHRLDECLRIGDYFTVLRDGNLVAEAPAADVTLDWIVERMAGRSRAALFPRSGHAVGAPLLEVDSLSLPRAHGGGYLVDHVSFTVRAGEIVGIYGLMGAGRTELMECLFGLQPAASGTVRIAGRALRAEPISERIQAGLAFVSEDRQKLGLVQSLSVAANITLASLGSLRKGLVLSRRKEREAVQRMIQALAIKVSHPDQPVTALSGGNQQKVVIAQRLLTGPKVLLMDEPTRGIDIGAKADVFRIMSDMARQGMGVLFVSSELKEVVAMADRALVMARGRITADLSRTEITEAALAAASVAGIDTRTSQVHAHD